jgi:hypothetical protein
MFFVFGSLLLVLAILSGFGVALSRRRETDQSSFFDFAILGFLPISAIGLIVNFFVPLRPYVVITIAAIGSILFILNRKRLWRSLGRRPGIVLAASGALLLMATIGILVTALNYDTGLYHLQLTEWLEHSTKIFGLANLHYRFGFNSIWFADATAFDLTQGNHEFIFVLNSALFVITMGALLHPIFNGTAGISAIRISNLYSIIILVTFIVTSPKLIFRTSYASPSNDLPAALMVIYAFWNFLKLFEEDGEIEPHFLYLLVGCAMAVMIKLTSVPLLLLVPAAWYVVIGKDWRRFIGLMRYPVSIGLAVVGVAWLASGLVSSGCLAFPAAASCFTALPWTPRLTDIRDFATVITAWARLPDADFMSAATGWAWLREWPARTLAARDFVLAAVAAFAVLAVIGFGTALIDRFFIRGVQSEAVWSGRPNGTDIAMILYAVLISLLGNLFWFLAAPDPRFGIGFLLVLPAIVIAAGTRWLSVDGAIIRPIAQHALLAGFIFVSAGLFVAHRWAEAAQTAKTWPAIPQADLVVLDLGPSIRANVPVGSDQCWDAPLPCAPNGSGGTAPLREGDLAFWHFFAPFPPPAEVKP